MIGQWQIPAQWLAPWLAAPAAAMLTLFWTGMHVLGGSARKEAAAKDQSGGEAVPASRGRSRIVRMLWVIARTAAGLAALLAIFKAAQARVVFATDIPLWALGLAGSAGVELAAGLCRPELRTIGRAAGAMIASFRSGMVVLIVLVLAQPVIVADQSKRVRRTVAVLLDESASMRQADPRMTGAVRLRLAEAAGAGDANRPYRLDETALKIQSLAKSLEGLSDEIERLSAGTADGDGQFQKDKKNILERLTGVSGQADRQADEVSRATGAGLKIDAAVQQAMADVKTALTVHVRDRLKEALRLLESPNFQRTGLEKVSQQIRMAVQNAARAAGELPGLADKVDQAAYESLPAATRQKTDRIAEMTRLQLAGTILLGGGAGEKSARKGLLDLLGGEYDVRIYGFAGDSSVISRDNLAGEVADASGGRAGKQSATSASGPTNGPAEQVKSAERSGHPPAGSAMKTDIAGAVGRVLKDVPAEDLAGVIVLTDGRHNADSGIDPSAAQLSARRAAACTILMGGDVPTPDAAVVSVDAPQALAAGDRLAAQAVIKLDGLAGKAVKVSLTQGVRQADVKTITPPTDNYRATVGLADSPAGGGMHNYTVAVDAGQADAVAFNNSLPVSVGVAPERMKVLLIEDRPRWDFRYVKNLFAGRDESVSLQYVLMEPDRIEPYRPAALVAASASRGPDQSQATALPDGKTEWMKFDAVILGDVSPSALGGKAMDAIREFVSVRGGTLIVIAGRDHMPAGYFGDSQAKNTAASSSVATGPALPASFADLLPVAPAGGLASGPAAAPAQRGFRLAATEEGSRHMLLQIADDPLASQAAWQALPEFSWRCPLRARDTAAVLAYAVDARSSASGRPEYLDPNEASQIRAFQRANPLIAWQNVGAGRVLFMAFDETWRLRFRTGDQKHHRFWGQLIRWACPEKLSGGVDNLRIGTDRVRYDGPGQVQVRARLLDLAFAPVAADDAAVELLDAGGAAVRRVPLLPVEGSPGAYQAGLGEVAPGFYRVRLASKVLERLLLPEGRDKVVAEFQVAPLPAGELVELSPDPALPRRLAAMTGGAVFTPHQAADVVYLLGKPVRLIEDRRQYQVWDSWWLFAAIVLLAGAEWVVRKVAGLP
ncbi:MAG: hypothetical protein HZA50_01245 [Planctomycetes bacterium]|nr:hypothetical protein [Planctomycetota bacterium]